MAKNRYKLTQQLDGVRASLKEAVNKVDNLYADPKSTLEERREAENAVVATEMEISAKTINVEGLQDEIVKYEQNIR